MWVFPAAQRTLLTLQLCSTTTTTSNSKTQNATYVFFFFLASTDTTAVHYKLIIFVITGITAYDLILLALLLRTGALELLSIAIDVWVPPAAERIDSRLHTPQWYES